MRSPRARAVPLAFATLIPLSVPMTTTPPGGYPVMHCTTSP
jgi:hypothetical protein